MADPFSANHDVTETQTCPECGYENTSDAISCVRCMAALPSAMSELSSIFTSMLKQIAVPCAACGHINRVGELVCESCGTMLVTATDSAFNPSTNPLEKDEPTTSSLTTMEVPGVEPQPTKGKGTAPLKLPNAGTAPLPDQTYFDDDMLLRLEVAGAPTPIMLYPSIETVIGRRDPVSGQTPDVDLGTFAGYRLGISRRHAILSLHDHELDIIDQGSSNGTLLNGRPLKPEEPELLRSGDQLTFGKMTVKVSFVKRK